jgi:hypothetical protein
MIVQTMRILAHGSHRIEQVSLIAGVECSDRHETYAMRPTGKRLISRPNLSLQRLARRYISWRLQRSKRSLEQNTLGATPLCKHGIRHAEIESLITAALEVLAEEPRTPPSLVNAADTGGAESTRERHQINPSE